MMKRYKKYHVAVEALKAQAITLKHLELYPAILDLAFKIEL